MCEFPLVAPVTGLVTATTQVQLGRPLSVLIEVDFRYGSGGGSFSCWIQSSIDGDTFFDTAPHLAGDGTLPANTAIDGVVGDLWRCKVTTTGFYADSTLSVDLSPAGQST
jgi:hypothetical protein